MKNKFNFYEIVKITSKNKALSEIYEQEGVILGMAENDNGTWGYAVFVNNDTWDIEENYLVTTGNFSSKEEFYSGHTVKVIVDNNGNGDIKKK